MGKKQKVEGRVGVGQTLGLPLWRLSANEREDTPWYGASLQQTAELTVEI